MPLTIREQQQFDTALEIPLPILKMAIVSQAADSVAYSQAQLTQFGEEVSESFKAAAFKAWKRRLYADSVPKKQPSGILQDCGR